MKIFTISIFLVLVNLLCSAQPLGFNPDISRSLFHDKLDAAQARLTASDGRSDSLIHDYDFPELNDQLSFLANMKIDLFQQKIESNSQTTHQQKLNIIRGLTELLTQFTADIQYHKKKWFQFPTVLEAYFDAALRLEKNDPIYPAIAELPYAEAKMIVENFSFQNALDGRILREQLALKMAVDRPDLLLSHLSKNLNYYFTDSLVAIAARKRPEDLISFAQAKNTPFANKIRQNPDSVVQWVVKLSESKSGQLYLPFFYQLTEGQTTTEEIEKATQDEHAYYKLLVKAQIAQAKRVWDGDSSLLVKGLQQMLHRKSLETYVNTINGLHESPAAIRFKKIQGLNAEELYYLIVLNESEIYTSSYMYVYNRMMELAPEKKSEALLAAVYNDRFKKFLTMASNYNTLDGFLKNMDKDKATELMRNFVNNLERGVNEDDIEDAVDVANAYASVNDSLYRSVMLQQVSLNEQRMAKQNNRKGSTIYRIERVIMESSNAQRDSSLPAINISDSLSIQPVYDISNKKLQDSSGRIVMQMFFYGDAGGKGTFNHLMRLYGDRSKWAMTSTNQWVKFTSIKTPVPVVLFANRALDEENDQDEKAQEALIDWMLENDWAPAITVHRGHSYFLPYTIKKMLRSQVVILGSCGAYHSLSDILVTSPDAYIIGSKQVGYGEINVALFTYLLDKLKAGNDIKWPVMMKEVSNRLSGGMKQDYEDYIFPHQNLGALMIKAYKIAMEKSATSTNSQGS